MTTKEETRSLWELCQTALREDAPQVRRRYEGWVYLKTKDGPQRTLELYVSPSGRPMFRIEARRSGLVQVTRHAGTKQATGPEDLARLVDAHMIRTVQRELANLAGSRVNRAVARAMLAQDPQAYRTQPSLQRTLLEEAGRIAANISPTAGQLRNDSDVVSFLTIRRADAVDLLKSDFFLEPTRKLMDSFKPGSRDYAANYNNTARNHVALRLLLPAGSLAGVIYAENLMHLPAYDKGGRTPAEVENAVQRYTGLDQRQLETLGRDPAARADWRPTRESRDEPQPEPEQERRQSARAVAQAIIDCHHEIRGQLPHGITRDLATTARRMADQPPETRQQWLVALRDYLKAASMPQDEVLPAVNCLNTIAQAITICRQEGIEWKRAGIRRMEVAASEIVARQRKVA